MAGTQEVLHSCHQYHLEGQLEGLHDNHPYLQTSAYLLQTGVVPCGMIMINTM